MEKPSLSWVTGGCFGLFSLVSFLPCSCHQVSSCAVEEGRREWRKQCGVWVRCSGEEGEEEVAGTAASPRCPAQLCSPGSIPALERAPVPCWRLEQAINQKFLVHCWCPQPRRGWQRWTCFNWHVGDIVGMARALLGWGSTKGVFHPLCQISSLGKHEKQPGSPLWRCGKGNSRH